jgi:predicted P-loop ATPase
MNEEKLTPEQVRATLVCNNKGLPTNSLGNCTTVLKLDENLAGAIKYNSLTGRIEIVKDLGWARESSTLTDTDLKYFYLYFERTYGLTNQKHIVNAVGIVANDNQYHPIREYLNKLQWDGRDRVRYALQKYLGADTSDYTYECLKVFMLGAIDRVFHPGEKFDLMLCLVGGQGAGKSTFFRFLAVKDEWFSDDLKRLDDENVYRKLEGHWIIEMSEMIATANAKSIEEIKSFLSRQKETYKVPYETYAQDRLRQCVFAGTTNKRDFLPKDRSGNRRFLPIMVHAEEAEEHILDNEESSRAYIEQMWAEVMEIYRTGRYVLKLPERFEANLKDYQSDFMQEDTQAGQIYAWLEQTTETKVCSKQIYLEALGNTFKEPASWETRNICEIVNTGIENGDIVGWRAFKNAKRFKAYGKQKGWERIPSVEKHLNDDTSGFILVEGDIDNPFA